MSRLLQPNLYTARVLARHIYADLLEKAQIAREWGFETDDAWDLAHWAMDICEEENTERATMEWMFSDPL